MAVFLVPALLSKWLFIYFASAAVSVDSSHMTASSFVSWSRFSLPSNSVNGHVSTMWFMVCRWPSSQEGDWVRPNLCKLARHGPWPVRKRFIRDHVWRGRLKPGCQIVGSFDIAVSYFFFPPFDFFPPAAPLLAPLLVCAWDDAPLWLRDLSFGIISHRYSSNDCPATNTQ